MADRTLELILYVANRAPKNTVYWVLKSIYFADRKHLLEFGRRIHDDRYIAMEDGPVPSYAYDLFKNVRYDRTNRQDYKVSAGQFDVADDIHIVPRRDADMAVFSKSEIACLDKSIAEVCDLSFGQLRERSHDEAWKAASTNGAMRIEDIISAMEGGKEALPHIQGRLLKAR